MSGIEVVLDYLARIPAEAVSIWSSGGWGMFALAANALVIFGLGIHVWLRLRDTGFRSVREETWRRWILHPEERRGPIGSMLDRVSLAASASEIATRFEEVRSTEVRPYVRDLKVMRICVSAAPLLGLLGTVTGMLSTFAALSGGSAGDETMNLVAAGISEALVTTETGLVIALPGLFFQYQLSRKHEQYRAFLAHLETVCAQTAHRRRARLRQAA